MDHSYLCRAWGETDLPCAQVVPDLAGVRAFLIREWLGSGDHTADDGTLLLPEAMQDLDDHDWSDDDTWSMAFEIGGVSVERVFESAAHPDTERLDYLISRSAHVGFTKDSELCRVAVYDEEGDYVPACGWDKFFHDPREAIDAARSAIPQAKG